MFEQLKWGAIAAALVAVMTLGMTAWDQHQVIVDQKAKLNKHVDCIDALGGKGDVATACDAAISVAYDRAQRARTCDQALLQEGFAPECSVAVAQLVGNYATVKAQLQSTVADRDAAIARASARATADTLRKTQDEHALAAAPRQPDGLIVCNAECLRQRFETDTR